MSLTYLASRSLTNHDRCSDNCVLVHNYSWIMNITKAALTTTRRRQNGLIATMRR